MLKLTRIFHHTLQPPLLLLKFHLMSKLLLDQVTDIQLEERSNGRLGPKILKIGETSKPIVLMQEFHICPKFNLTHKLEMLDHQALLVIQLFLHNLPLLHQL